MCAKGSKVLCQPCGGNFSKVIWGLGKTGQELESGLLLDSLWSMGTDKTYQGKEIKECENSCAHNFEVVLVLE